MKRITDQERLDWLELGGHVTQMNDFQSPSGEIRQGFFLAFYRGSRDVARGKTKRQAIDAAIRAERKGR